MKGYLEKLSPHMLQGWQQRHFEIKGTELLYFESETEFKPKGKIDLTTVISVGMGFSPDEPAKQSMEFFLKTAERVFHLRAQTQYETNNWIEVIQKIIKPTHKRSKSNGSRAFSTATVAKEILQQDDGTLSVSKNGTSGGKVIQIDQLFATSVRGPANITSAFVPLKDDEVENVKKSKASNYLVHKSAGSFDTPPPPFVERRSELVAYEPLFKSKSIEEELEPIHSNARAMTPGRTSVSTCILL